MLSQTTSLKDRDRVGTGTGPVLFQCPETAAPLALGIVAESLKVYELPRLNYCGFCRVCARQGCGEVGCRVYWSRLNWGPCTRCDGVGYRDPQMSDPCGSCIDGLAELATRNVTVIGGAE